MNSGCKSAKTLRRLRLADKIQRLGFLAMARCPQCEKANERCVVMKGRARCSCCERKNIVCGGTFSDAEFEALDSRKTKIAAAKMEARAKLTRLAYEILAAQKEVDKLEAQFAKIHKKQEDMVLREAQALDELDLFEGFPAVEASQRHEDRSVPDLYNGFVEREPR